VTSHRVVIKKANKQATKIIVGNINVLFIKEQEGN